MEILNNAFMEVKNRQLREMRIKEVEIFIAEGELEDFDAYYVERLPHWRKTGDIIDRNLAMQKLVENYLGNYLTTLPPVKKNTVPGYQVF